MIGQESLKKELFSYNLTQFPKTLLFLGDSGCGKHTLTMELADNLHLPLVDITDIISSETLETIQLSALLTMYLIDLDKLTERAQNIVLKFIEEPSDTAYVILISSNENRVLDTILNRCYKCKFSAYSKEELKQITGEDVSEELLSACSTPGQIKLSQRHFVEIKQLCITIIARLDKANFSNALTIVNKINYKDEYDKYDLTVFLKVLLNELYLSYINGNNKSLKLYNIVNAESKKLIDFRLNKEIFMQHLVTLLWKASKGE